MEVSKVVGDGGCGCEGGEDEVSGWSDGRGEVASGALNETDFESAVGSLGGVV